MSHQPDNIFAGTQVVSLVEVRGTNNSLVHPRGAVGALNEADINFHESEYERLRSQLQAAHDASNLPEAPSERSRAALNELLIGIRLKRWTSHFGSSLPEPAEECLLFVTNAERLDFAT